jgi:hypothetical protein
LLRSRVKIGIHDDREGFPRGSTQPTARGAPSATSNAETYHEATMRQIKTNREQLRASSRPRLTEKTPPNLVSNARRAKADQSGVRDRFIGMAKHRRPVAVIYNNRATHCRSTVEQNGRTFLTSGFAEAMKRGEPNRQLYESDLFFTGNHLDGL